MAGLLRWAGPPADPGAARAVLRSGEHLALAERLGGATWAAGRRAGSHPRLRPGRGAGVSGARGS